MDLNEQQIFLNNFSKPLIEGLSQLKRHYFIISLYQIIKKGDYPKKLPFQEISSFYGKLHVEDGKIIIKDSCKVKQLQNIFKNLQNNKASDNFFDIVTYSYIPSLFSFFIDEQTFGSFIDFINELSPENDQAGFNLQVILSRSLFVSPLFIRFLQHVFNQLLQNFLYGQAQIFFAYDPNYIKKIQNTILKSIKSNFDIFPSYLSLFFKNFKNKSKIKELFKLSFIKPFVQDPTLFQVVDPWVLDSKNQFDKVQNFLKEILLDFSDEIFTAIEESNVCFDSFLKHEKSHYFHQIISFGSVYDIFDCILMERIKTEAYEDDIFNFIINLNFKEYTLFYGQLEDKSFILNESEINDLKLILHEEFSPFLQAIKKICDHSIGLLNTFITHDIKPEEEIEIPRLSYLMVQNPSECKKQMIQYYNSCQKIAESVADCNNSIFIHRYLQNLTFNRYIAERAQLLVYDKMLEDYLANNYDNVLIEILNNQTFPSTEDFLANKEALFRYSMELRSVFIESCDPLTKLTHILDTFDRFFGKYLVQMLAFEESIILFILFFAFANPPHMISNIIFVYEYLYKVNYHNTIELYLYCFTSSCQYLFDKVYTKNPIIIEKLARQEKSNDGSSNDDKPSSLLNLFKRKSGKRK